MSHSGLKFNMSCKVNKWFYLVLRGSRKDKRGTRKMKVFLGFSKLNRPPKKSNLFLLFHQWLFKEGVDEDYIWVQSILECTVSRAKLITGKSTRTEGKHELHQVEHQGLGWIANGLASLISLTSLLSQQKPSSVENENAMNSN